MIKIKISQGYNEVAFEVERYADAELLVNTIMGLCDERTSITINNGEETDASRLQKEVTNLGTRLNAKGTELFTQQGELEKLRGELMACMLE